MRNGGIPPGSNSFLPCPVLLQTLPRDVEGGEVLPTLLSSSSILQIARGSPWRIRKSFQGVWIADLEEHTVARGKGVPMWVPSHLASQDAGFSRTRKT
jgi:hypothetical protein